MKLPVKTVQRLSRYRRLLVKYKYLDEPHIFSHDLARLCNLNPVQVRRDLMLIGSTGNHRYGYNVNELIRLIEENIDNKNGQNLCIVGMGKIAQAITQYLHESEIYQNIVAVFDIDSVKVGKDFEGIPCFDISKLSEIIQKENIRIAILTVPTDYAISITDILIQSGIKGILNFTSVKLETHDDIYIKEFDIVTSLEEIAYFVKNRKYLY